MNNLFLNVLANFTGSISYFFCCVLNGFCCKIGQLLKKNAYISCHNNNKFQIVLSFPGMKFYQGLLDPPNKTLLWISMTTVTLKSVPEK